MSQQSLEVIKANVILFLEVRKSAWRCEMLNQGLCNQWTGMDLIMVMGF